MFTSSHFEKARSICLRQMSVLTMVLLLRVCQLQLCIHQRHDQHQHRHLYHHSHHHLHHHHNFNFLRSPQYSPHNFYSPQLQRRRPPHSTSRCPHFTHL